MRMLCSLNTYIDYNYTDFKLNIFIDLFGLTVDQSVKGGSKECLRSVGVIAQYKLQMQFLVWHYLRNVIMMNPKIYLNKKKSSLKSFRMV